MPFILKYLQGFFRFHLKHLISGSKDELTTINGQYSLKTATLKNEKLAAELESACRRNYGVLTFAEYLAIDQFGTNGYHANNSYHGEQEKFKYWGEALAKYCIAKGISNIIDFGPGNGDLGISTLTYGNGIKKKFSWNGIEINEKLRITIKKKFEKTKLSPQLLCLTSKLDDLPIDRKSAVIFSFSLDNLPPEMLINTAGSLSSPTSVLGITMHKNILREVILTDEQLKQKGISLNDGIFTDIQKQALDLSAWKLRHFQRACVPLQAVTILTSLTERLPKGSVILIIDEFSPVPYYAHNKHLNFPKDLMAYWRYFEDLKELYETSGNNLLYFPTYTDSYSRVLKSLGYSNIEVAFEHEMLNKLAKKTILKPIKGLCLAITGTKKQSIKFPVALGSYRPCNK
jgi:SAM-dependent MidA family methyltransferase